MRVRVCQTAIRATGSCPQTLDRYGKRSLLLGRQLHCPCWRGIPCFGGRGDETLNAVRIRKRPSLWAPRNFYKRACVRLGLLHRQPETGQLFLTVIKHSHGARDCSYDAPAKCDRARSVGAFIFLGSRIAFRGSRVSRAATASRQQSQTKKNNWKTSANVHAGSLRANATRCQTCT